MLTESQIIAHLTPVISKIADKLFHLGSSALNFSKEEFLRRSGLAFTAYYQRASEKYGYTKTILYRDKPVPLYDFYVHPNLGSSSDSTAIISTKSIDDCIEAGHHLIIVGSAGSGKSTLLKHLFLSSLCTGNQLPVFVELRSINDSQHQDFVDFLYDKICDLGFSLERDTFMRMLDSGSFLLLLDGFDELKSEACGETELRINRFRDRYHSNCIIVTSRKDPRFMGWGNFRELKVLPLSKDQALALIDRLDYEKTIKESFRERVQTELFISHKSFLENPLLLTLMLMTYESSGSIPRNETTFLQRAFDELYSRHDASKTGYKRRLQAGLTSDEFLDALSAFCMLCFRQNKLEFSSLTDCIDIISKSRQLTSKELTYDSSKFLSDLNLALCILIQDGLAYSFTHRKFQEYFAARFIILTPKSHQYKFLKLAASRLPSDGVVKLAFELNQSAVEDNLLLPALQKIADDINWLQTTREESFFAWISLAYDRIAVRENSFSLDGICEEEAIIMFVMEAYKPTFAPQMPYSIDDLKNLVAKHTSIDITREFEIVWGNRQSTPNSQSIGLEPFANNPDLRRALIGLLWFFVNRLEVALQVRDQILLHRQQSDKYLDELLLGT